MFDSIRERFQADDRYARITGTVLILIGLIVFLVMIFTLIPVLRDPTATHDRWFPEETDEPVAEEEEPTGPAAGFNWVAEARYEQPPGGGGAQLVYAARFEDTSEEGDVAIVRWTWDLGDGTTRTGPYPEHQYDQPGDYRIELEVEDEAGLVSRTDGRLYMPEDGREEGEVAPDVELLDLSGIEASVDDLVGTLADSVRAMVIIGLFSIAAFILTLVAWRVIRSGVMLLRPIYAAPKNAKREPTPPPAPGY
jgi:hypothetical protein